MASIVSVLLAVMLLVSANLASCQDYANCSKDMDVLALALYNYTPENKRQLISNFYPPREGASHFIKVNYTFEGSDCKVTYIWANGGFLLMQPPKIFQYTSLFFSTLANKKLDMVLKLPNDCLPLVNGDSCSCSYNESNANEDNLLDILTQQLNIYAKYSSPDTVIRDTSLHVQAICGDDLKKEYFTSPKAKFFMVFTLMIPIFSTVVILIMVRSMHEGINRELALKRNHGSFAALIIMGIYGQFVMIAMDAAALGHVAFKKYEYSNYSVQHTINFSITFLTFSFNSGIGLILLICLMYLSCTLCHRDAKKNCPQCAPYPTFCLEGCLACFLVPLFFGILGKRQDTAWKMPERYTLEDGREQTVASRRMSWVLLVMLISPLFSLASHGGYILAAWLTEPLKATETALILLAALIYANFVLRHCYMVNSKANIQRKGWSIWIPLYFIWQCFEYAYKMCCKQTVCALILSTRNNRNQDEMRNLLEGQRNKDTNENFNTQALCIVLGWSTLIFASLAFTFVAFHEVPFETLDLATYLVNILQVLIVVIAALVTYKILIFGEPEIYRFIKKVRKAYEEKTEPDEEHFDDLEAVGVVAGNALDAIIKRK